VLGTGEEGFYLIIYQDGTSALATADQSLVALEQGVAQAINFPGANRVAIHYGDGRVNYIDLNLIAAAGGVDAASRLAAMSPDDLIAFTCATLFTDNPEWDEAKLEAYTDFLPEGRARACGD